MCVVCTCDFLKVVTNIWYIFYASENITIMFTKKNADIFNTSSTLWEAEHKMCVFFIIKGLLESFK